MKKSLIMKSSILAITSVFTIGYANWTITNDFSKDFIGKINAENVLNSNVTILKKVNYDNMNPILISDNGIVEDEELKNNVTLSFTFELDNSTCKENIVTYECHLLCRNINNSIESYFQNVNLENATIDNTYNSGFGPFVKNQHEHIMQIVVQKGSQNTTEFTINYNFFNFSQIISTSKDMSVNIKIFSI